MRKTLLLYLSLCSLLLAGCIPPPAPQDFTSDDGRFSVTFPATPTETSQSVDTAAGKIDIHMFTAEKRDAAFIIGYSDYPADLVEQAGTEVLLDGARDGAAANVNGAVTGETEIDLNGFPGRELIIEAKPENAPEMMVKARIFMVESRLYQVLVAAPKTTLNLAEIDAFLQSFKLTGR